MKKSYLAILGTVLLLVIVVGLFWQAAEGGRAGRISGVSSTDMIRPTEGPPAVPQALGELKLVNSMSGQEALAQIRRLHGQDFPIVGGYVAHYAAAGAEATLWVAQAQGESQSQELLRRMTERIQAGNPVFTGPQPIQVGQWVIYSLVGQGQQHYYYQVGDKVVWLEADPAYASDLLHAALQIVR